MSGRDVLSNDRKKAPADCQECRSKERLVKRPWLQFMCCTPVSGREVGRIFRSSESRRDRGPKQVN